MMWGDKPYHSLDFELKKQFGKKLYKISLDGGMTCPNRDGTLGYGGCTFCSEGGSGEFAQRTGTCEDVWQQIEKAKKQVEKKMPEGGKYIAYFQAYTNTYGPVSYLEPLFTKAISHPDVEVLSIATRPDCLPPKTVELLRGLNEKKPVWIELGLQTIHECTAERIRRGYKLPVFQSAYADLKEAGLTVVVHVILGLPGETREMMLDTVKYLGSLAVDGIKLQLLHILRGTDLAREYEEKPFYLLSLDEYADLITDCISVLPESVVIHRISGDGPKSILMAPQWSRNKKMVLNTVAKRFRQRKMCQGSGSMVDK
ncbi:MAG: TIGR01212 family radical SAM protein [Hungatella sp.]|jgi:radical SAM protein (TIGR01212 family)|nr:TIGR01212 family radical SAM protein [Hungatella sp.]